MTDLPDTYDSDTVESKWRDEWQDSDLYEYEDTDPDYVIDTPPPYPTGNLHLGHALQWAYIDFAARYHRLQGDDVLFPQGWDCHGLPTEVKVEEIHDIHRTDVPREEFREMCVEYTEGQIDSMKETMLDLGFGIDWSAEFKTMDPAYWGTTQQSFVEMADSGYVYRDEHPVNWCPRCRTAIADAEVETEEGVEGTLYSVTFPGVGNDDIEIATTRPELLAACVSIAVDPDDERYADRVEHSSTDGASGEPASGGDTFEVPLFGQEVELVADGAVDGDFGTGAVMICTFGDKQDVDWWAEYDLDLRPAFSEDGTLTAVADDYAGLGIDEAKESIAADLEEAGYLNETEPTTQNVGQCWRCDTPIEILSKEQWFVEVRQEEILEHAQAADWIPEHMYDRLEDWTEGMDWDWVVSRQRVFATPIPAWECTDCGYWHVADADEVPVTPSEEDPAVGECPECGGSATPEESRADGSEAAGTDWRGETDVMDTWMDSSITPLHLRGWPDDLDLDEFEPTALRPQGHDIIRTWAFYTLLRVGSMADEKPWDDVLINGMVFGSDGNKMSKSRGNFVTPEEGIEEFGADAIREALVLGGQPGSDVQYQPKEATSAARFHTKIWNITRFATEHLVTDMPTREDPAYRDADTWILSRCSQVADAVAGHMDEYRYDAALRELREFVWHDLADDYLELIKGRLYDGRPGERNAARQALATALSASLRMLSPFAPFLTAEAWAALPTTEGSVHESDWPALDKEDETAELAGSLIADVASTIRGWKSDRGMALNAPLDKVEVYPDRTPDRAVDTYDLSEAVNAPVMVREGVPTVELVPVEVEPDHSTIGPEFRDQADEVVAALEAMDPAAVQSQKQVDDEIEVDFGGDSEAQSASERSSGGAPREVAVVPGDAVSITEEHRAESGEEVAVLEGDNGTILVYP